MPQNKKYKFTGDTIQYDGGALHRIRALVDIPSIRVQIGDLGGYVESENNLAINENAWVSDNAKVFGDARVLNDAQVFGDACVYSNAQVLGSARVFNNAQVFGNARVSGNAKVFGGAWVSGNAQVSGNAWVLDNARVSKNASVSDNARVSGNARVFGNARVCAPRHIFSIGPVGSENSVLTVYRGPRGALVSRGYFSGTLDEFAEEFERKHGDTKYGQEYRLLIQLAKLRAAEWEEK